MDLEELEPRKKTPQPKNLDECSIEELHAYIGELQAEIERARAKIAVKEAHRAGAAGIFKKG